MDRIIQGVYRVEHWFATEEANAMYLEEALTVQPVDVCDKSVLGYISWKAMEVHYLPIERKQDFLQKCKPKVDNLWQTISTIQSSADPYLEWYAMFVPKSRYTCKDLYGDIL